MAEGCRDITNEVRAAEEAASKVDFDRQYLLPDLAQIRRVVRTAYEHGYTQALLDKADKTEELGTVIDTLSQHLTRLPEMEKALVQMDFIRYLAKTNQLAAFHDFGALGFYPPEKFERGFEKHIQEWMQRAINNGEWFVPPGLRMP